jgi:hypothetical protein
VHDSEDCAAGLRFAVSEPERVREAQEQNRKTVAERLDRATGLARLEKLLENAAAMHR